MGESTTDKRIVCAFEVDFRNGGGIQGQGLRLKVDGDGIEDGHLADAIVRELNLLMVGDVRILRKEIVGERHDGAATPSRQVDGRRVHIDLSHTISEGLITYKGIPAPLICDFLSREDSRRIMTRGPASRLGGSIWWRIRAHTSTVLFTASRTARTFRNWSWLRWRGLRASWHA